MWKLSLPTHKCCSSHVKSRLFDTKMKLEKQFTGILCETFHSVVISWNHCHCEVSW